MTLHLKYELKKLPDTAFAKLFLKSVNESTDVESSGIRLVFIKFPQLNLLKSSPKISIKSHLIQLMIN
jgi:hypothetical protein